MARTLAAYNILVVCPDYRNFPSGRVGDMLEDVDNAMEWVRRPPPFRTRPERAAPAIMDNLSERR